MPVVSEMGIPLPDVASPSYKEDVAHFNKRTYEVSQTLEPRGVERPELPPGSRIFSDPRLIKARNAVLTNPSKSRTRTDSVVSQEVVVRKGWGGMCLLERGW